MWHSPIIVWLRSKHTVTAYSTLGSTDLSSLGNQSDLSTYVQAPKARGVYLATQMLEFSVEMSRTLYP